MIEERAVFKEVKCLAQDPYGFGGAEVKFESQSLSNLSLRIVTLEGSIRWFDPERCPRTWPV